VALGEDTATWHWTQHHEAEEIQQVVACQGSFSSFGQGPVGHGLYLSLSAVDTIERGLDPIRMVLRKGTRLLVADPRVFNVGVPEILIGEIKRASLVRWRPPLLWRAAREAVAADVPGAVDGLLARLEVPACLFIFGLCLAVMVRDARCLRIDPDVDPAGSVLAYHEQHPLESPTLAPQLLTGFVSRLREARG
jgi:hypothetical protein